MFPAPSTSQRGGLPRSPLTILLLTLWVAAMGLQGCATVGTDSRQAQEDPKPRQVQASFLSVPLSFEANQGQTDPQVKFLSRGPGYGLFLTPSEAVLALRKAESTPSEAATDETLSESAVLRMRLVRANPTPELSGETALPGKVNYFKGNDPTKWRTNVPTYAQARYTNVYPGIDLIYYGNQQQLEYDFVVAPGQDPASITMAFEGADRLELDANTGDLVLQTAGGAIRQRKPIIYQEVGDERQEIAGNYLLKNNDQVAFQVAAYDATKPLIIDPILVFSTYLGGSSLGGSPFSGDVAEGGFAIAVDGAGQAYVTGLTFSADFPTANPLQPPGSLGDVFVAQLTADGTALGYATYLGGSDLELGSGIAVDSAGRAYVTGRTFSADFPMMNPFQATFGGGLTDAFVAQLTADGAALGYATYLGGSEGDSGSDIAVDGIGNAYVTGDTESTDFPTANPLQPPGSFGDAFVTKLNPGGTALLYSTCLGGSGPDFGSGIAVDGAGQAYVTGRTFSADFPMMNPFQATFGGGLTDAFVAQLTADGTALGYATYLGGSDLELGSGIAVDGAGRAYVTGITRSADFPMMNPFQATFGGGLADAFVAQLTADGAALGYATYLGGSEGDSGSDIAVDGVGNAYVTGDTQSTNFPTVNPLQLACGGGDGDAFVTKLNPAGTALLFSTCLGGSAEPGGDSGLSITADGAGNAYVTGFTNSTDFPTANPLQPTLDGIDDIFVAKIATRALLNDKFAPLVPSDVTTAFSAAPCGGASAGTFTITVTFTNTSADTLTNLVVAVNALTGGNVLCNADGGHGGAGATLTVPLQGDLADGQLSPGEAFVVELPVGLQSFNPFTFLVDVLGEVD